MNPAEESPVVSYHAGRFCLVGRLLIGFEIILLKKIMANRQVSHYQSFSGSTYFETNVKSTREFSIL